MLFTHETFLAYKFETLKNCKKLKHIMIMNIPLIYIFSSYVIFDQQLKITLISKPFSWKTLSLPPPEKIHSPLFTDPPPKYSNTASPPLLANIEKLTLISYMITINMVNCKCRFVFLRLWCSVRFLMQIRFFWFDLWSELLLLKVELTELLNLFELLKLNHWTYLDQ